MVKRVCCLLALLFCIFPLTCYWLCQTQAWMDFDLILYGHSHMLMNCSFSKIYFIPIQMYTIAFLLLHGQANKQVRYKWIFFPKKALLYIRQTFTHEMMELLHKLFRDLHLVQDTMKSTRHWQSFRGFSNTFHKTLFIKRLTLAEFG